MMQGCEMNKSTEKCNSHPSKSFRATIWVFAISLYAIGNAVVLLVATIAGEGLLLTTTINIAAIAIICAVLIMYQKKHKAQLEQDSPGGDAK